jgi:hypothetical protein
MATNKPCRFTTSELKVLLKHLPEAERRLIVKLNHYVKSTVEVLYKEDKVQRLAASNRRVINLAKNLNQNIT